MTTIDRRTALRLGLGLPFAVGFTPAALRAQDGGTPPGDDSELTGQLPSVDLPTMSSQGYEFQLESTFSGSFDDAPAEASVYRLDQPALTQDDVKSVAERLGVEGDVQDQGGGSFSVEGNGSLFVTPGLMQYNSPNEAPDEGLPADDEAIAYGSEWLRQTQLIPADLGNGAVAVRIESPPRLIINYKPIKPAPLLSDTPGITITVGSGGTIIQASFRWADISAGDTYQLRGGESAWQEVAQRLSYLDVTLPSDVFPDGSRITGKAEYSQVGIVYSISGSPGETQYLQPVYEFKGQATPEGSGESYPITAYVAGILNALQPVGVRGDYDRG